ncbi:MAG: beta-N-acetylhexosaminidase [Rhodocyclaceae bacterium]|nr:beta-N-acetylhexosaminidase [Rhodocyclaceae bacterium]
MAGPQLPLGPVMLDIAGLNLTDPERQRLCHPLVGGVILFARNFDSGAQLAALTADIRALRSPQLLITVDQEGGRVQRFRHDFCALPAMRTLGALWDRDPDAARALARQTGLVLATELIAHGVDLSYAPVLDLDYGVSRAIGDRAFHRDPAVTVELAGALIDGLADAGMRCVGKHFPGHGFVEADSHVDMPRDGRPFEAIWAEDIAPFRALAPRLGGVMPAHVIYERVAPQPAGFSPFWLGEVLRGRLGFDGVVFSDDLTMEAATAAGDIVARAEAAARAGCDMVLVCNRPDLADELLARWVPAVNPALSDRLAALHARPAGGVDGRSDPAYAAGRAQLAALAERTRLG